MKRFAKIWSYSYTSVMIVFMILSFSILRNLNINVPFLRLAMGGMIIAFCLTASIMIFRAKSLNAFIRVIGAFILILPITFIARALFGVMIFRYSFIVYGFALISALIYAGVILTIARKVKSEEKELNDLIAKK